MEMMFHNINLIKTVTILCCLTRPNVQMYSINVSATGICSKVCNLSYSNLKLTVLLPLIKAEKRHTNFSGEKTERQYRPFMPISKPTCTKTQFSNCFHVW